MGEKQTKAIRDDTLESAHLSFAYPSPFIDRREDLVGASCKHGMITSFSPTDILDFGKLVVSETNPNWDAARLNALKSRKRR